MLVTPVMLIHCQLYCFAEKCRRLFSEFNPRMPVGSKTTPEQILNVSWGKSVRDKNLDFCDFS